MLAHLKTLDLGLDLFFEPGYTWKAVCDDLVNPAVAKILLNSREPLDRMGNMLISNFIKILVVF